MDYVLERSGYSELIENNLIISSMYLCKADNNNYYLFIIIIIIIIKYYYLLKPRIYITYNTNGPRNK